MIVQGFLTMPQPGQEVHVDHIDTVIGGGAALSSSGLARLGLRTAFYGILGRDLYGDYLHAQLQASGIHTDFIQRDALVGTGISIAVNVEANRSFITYSGTNANLNLDMPEEQVLRRARHVHLTGYKGSSRHDEFTRFARKAKSCGASISCDVGWDDTGEWHEGIVEFLRETDIFFFNETEAFHYSRCHAVPDALEALSAPGVQVIVKMGPGGCASLLGGAIVRLPSYPVVVVDTTGAGDAFNAGYLCGYLNGEAPRACMIRGNACGSLAVTRRGGFTAFPDRDTLERFLSIHGERN